MTFFLHHNSSIKFLLNGIESHYQKKYICSLQNTMLLCDWQPGFRKFYELECLYTDKSVGCSFSEVTNPGSITGNYL
jgi:hypothetical protein